MSTVINLIQATFDYRDTNLFSNLTLNIEQGDMICILGPNGCGKTTLLRCIHGTLKLKTGNVFLYGRDISSLKASEIAKNIGFVFQKNNISFPYTVLQVVLMGRAPHLSFFSAPSIKDIEISLEALEVLGVLHLKDRFFTKLSGGEQQLVLIARTLAQRPRIILFDEPTSHLDFGNQVMILRTIRNLSTVKGLTTVLTTHFPNHAFEIANRVVLMEKSGAINIGEPNHIITENNLRAVYGVDVKVISLANLMPYGGNFVVPVIDSKY